MTTKLHISPSLSLPIDFVTSTQVILAQKGKGKSYTAAVEAEEMLEAAQQIVIVDPTGAHFGLRSSPDGRSTGYPIAVFGGEHADVPLDAAAGEVVASAIATEHFSAILDMSLFRKGEALRFMAAFLETLYRKNRSPLHLFIDEADSYCPQKMFGPEQARCLGAAEDIVRRGRIRGIGCTLITQRPQVLNKDVLTQADMLTTLGMNHPKDLGAIEAWVAVHGDPAKAKTMIASLPSLPKGDAWVWNPSIDLFKRVTIRERHTFDSGRTPKPGERRVEAKVLAPIDIARLGATITATVEQAKANDPAALKRRVVELEKQLAAKPGAKVETKTVEKAIFKDGQLARIGVLLERGDKVVANAAALADKAGEMFKRGAELMAASSMKIEAELGQLRVAIASTKAPAPRTYSTPTDPIAAIRQAIPVVHRSGNGVPISSGAVGHGGLRRILIALAQRPQGLTNRQIGIRAGLSSKSGTFSNYLSKARTEGWIEDVGDIRRITRLGAEALGGFEPLPTGPALAEHWLRELGDSGAARILRALLDAYPDRLDNATIGERAGISPASGTFSNYVSKLRGLELVQGKPLAASEELFA